MASSGFDVKLPVPFFSIKNLCDDSFLLCFVVLLVLLFFKS